MGGFFDSIDLTRGQIVLHDGNDAWANMFTACASYFVFFVFIFFAVYIALGFACEDPNDVFAGRSEKPVSRGTVALKSFNIVHHIIVGPLAVIALVADPVSRAMLVFQGGAGMLRSDDLSRSASALAPVTIGFLAADLLFFNVWALPAGAPKTPTFVQKLFLPQSILMVFHHIMSMVSWPFAIEYDFCSRYVVVMLAYELSSVFLLSNWFISAAGYKSSMLYLASGALFTLSFIIIRLIGAVPQFVNLCGTMPWFQTTADYPGVLGWMPASSFVLLLPHVLNATWGRQVVEGAVKIVKGDQGKKERAPEEAPDGRFVASEKSPGVQEALLAS